MLEYNERYAYIHHDTLVEMGGRPTRAVLEKPAWKAEYEKDQIRILNYDGELQFTLGPDEDLTYHHWSDECFRFSEELDRWKEFREWQQGMEHQPLLNISFDPGDTDQRLVEILIRLNDWREFQHYQQVKVGRTAMKTWSINQVVRNNMRKEATLDKIDYPESLRYQLSTCLHELYGRQQDLEDSETQLTWIESQILEILSEACGSLDDTIPLQRELELKLEQQANAFYQDMKILEARPDHSVQHPYQSSGLAERIRHWGSETTRLMQERWEWKIFLKWRRLQPSKAANLEEQEPSGRSSDLQIWVDHIAYRRFQLERARDWVAAWQRLLTDDEDDMKTPPEGPELFILQDSIKMVGAYVERFRKDAHTVESQLRLAEQQLAELSSQQSSSAAFQITQQSTRRIQMPLSNPKPESTESMPGDCRLPNSSSVSTEAHRTREPSSSPMRGVQESIQQSNVSNTGMARRAKTSNIDKKMSVTIAKDILPDQVIVDDDIQMTDAPSDSYPHETINEARGSGLKDTIPVGVEDTSMTDVKNPVHNNSAPASEVDLKIRNTGSPRKWPSPIDQVPNSRKIRSMTKLKSNKILKNKGKKQAKKIKTFSKTQNTALLKSASTSYPTKPITLRRSARLQKRVPPSASTSPP